MEKSPASKSIHVVPCTQLPRRLSSSLHTPPWLQVVVGSGPAAVKCAVMSAKLGKALCSTCHTETCFYQEWPRSGQNRVEGMHMIDEGSNALY